MIIKIDDEIGGWGITAKYIQEQLDNASGDITIEINSPGGSVFEGITIFNALKAYEKGNITVVITGLAASIASYIALAGDTIKAYDNATFMIHNAWTFAYGDANELKKTADILEGLSSLIAKKYQEITQKNIKNIREMMDKETFLFGDEILENNFCDEIISTDTKSTKEESLALSSEAFNACYSHAKENYSSDEFVQSVAKLKKDGIIQNNQEIEVVSNLDDTKQQYRARQLDILKKGI